MILPLALYLALFAAQPVAAPSPGCDAAPTTNGPNPDSSGHYHLGDGVTPPKVVNRVVAEYSEEARRKKLSGVVTVGLTVDERGTPIDVHVVCSLADAVAPSLRHAALSLDQQAIDSVKNYKFTPGTVQGKPVPVDLRIRVSFQIH